VGLVGLAVALCGLPAGAQGAAKTAAGGDVDTIPVLMLSDLHFDPFRDGAKVARLAAAPVAEWDAILTEPNSESQATDFAALQVTCGAVKGVDTDHGLLSASLKAARTQGVGVKFVTISGDLLVHQFDCRYKTVMKADDKAGYAAFAEKTASYVMMQVEATFPGVPVYLALGNNDSSCGDYKMDMHDRFFAGTSGAAIDGLRGATAAETKQARVDYETGGYFAVTLPGPLKRTRLLAFDDIFMSRKYSGCGGKPDAKGAEDVLAWLGKELDAAREQGEQVWVMAHIPTGIDVYATLRKGDVCSGTAAETFLSRETTDALLDLLAGHAGVIRLAIFGHTHMDEMKLLRRVGEAGLGGVPVKVVGSISPVDGNLPSFTVARMNPATAIMEDYAVYVASNKSGAGTWTREYGFKDTYHAGSFTGGALWDLVGGLHADTKGATAASQSYEQYFDPGSPISPLVIAWPQYACGMDHSSEAGFKACMCGAEK